MCHLLASDAPADVLLDGDCSIIAPGIEGCPGSLPPAQLCCLPEAAAHEVAPHGSLDLDSCFVPLQSTRCITLFLSQVAPKGKRMGAVRQCMSLKFI